MPAALPFAAWVVVRSLRYAGTSIVLPALVGGARQQAAGLPDLPA
jgi:hypothetical protein